jgi:hypothetical protein
MMSYRSDGKRNPGSPLKGLLCSCGLNLQTSISLIPRQRSTYNVVDFHLHHQCQESRERHAASLSELTVYFVEHIDHRTEYESVTSKQKPVITPRWTVLTLPNVDTPVSCLGHP